MCICVGLWGVLHMVGPCRPAVSCAQLHHPANTSDPAPPPPPTSASWPPQGDLTQAARDWERAASAKNNGRPNVVGHLALAGLHYQQQHYKKALQQ